MPGIIDRACLELGIRCFPLILLHILGVRSQGFTNAVFYLLSQKQAVKKSLEKALGDFDEEEDDGFDRPPPEAQQRFTEGRKESMDLELHRVAKLSSYSGDSGLEEALRY